MVLDVSTTPTPDGFTLSQQPYDLTFPRTAPMQLLRHSVGEEQQPGLLIERGTGIYMACLAAL